MKQTKLPVMTLLLLLLTVSPVLAQDSTTIEAKSEDISDNLDLEAVASVFGEAKDLEDFEQRLNDPEAQLTNLDLNGDGEVDYLRVMETVQGDTHYIALQAVVGEDQFQDVASIEVEKDSSGDTQVQVVGDVYMYGSGYICEPVYVHPPIIFTIFWAPHYSPWHSPWYWGYHPPYYRPWRPYPVPRYRTNVRVNINVNNSYSYTSVRKSNTCVDLQKKSRKNDFERKNPDRSFSQRNPGVQNSRGLQEGGRARQKPEQGALRSGKTNTGVSTQKDWDPPSARKDAPKAETGSKAKDKRPQPSNDAFSNVDRGSRARQDSARGKKSRSPSAGKGGRRR